MLSAGWLCTAADVLVQADRDDGCRYCTGSRLLLPEHFQGAAQLVVGFARLPHNEYPQQTEVTDGAPTTANIPGIGGDRLLNQFDQLAGAGCFRRSAGKNCGRVRLWLGNSGSGG